MANSNLGVRGVRQPIGSGVVLGRTSSGQGQVEQIPIANLGGISGGGGGGSGGWNAGDVEFIGNGLTIVGETLAATGGGGNDFYSWAAGIPALSSFTQLNSSTATCSTQTNGNTAISVVDTGANSIEACGMYIGVPGTTPYMVGLFIQPDNQVFYQYAGPYIGWTNGTKIDGVQFTSDSFLFNTSFSNYSTRAGATGLNNNINPMTWGNGFWVGLEDDGTNISVKISQTGASFAFKTLYKVAKTSGYLGSAGYTNIFWGLIPQDNQDTIAVSLRCYDISALSGRTVG